MECPICLEETDDNVTLNCNHIFCKDCILKSIKSEYINCPLCRMNIEYYEYGGDKIKIVILQKIRYLIPNINAIRISKSTVLGYTGFCILLGYNIRNMFNLLI